MAKKTISEETEGIVLRLRMMGFSYPAISAACKISVGAAHKIVKRNQETINEVDEELHPFKYKQARLLALSMEVDTPKMEVMALNALDVKEPEESSTGSHIDKELVLEAANKVIDVLYPEND